MKGKEHTRMEEIELRIEQYCADYAERNEPIRINFRQLVPELNNSERYSHLIHSYPAKLLSNISFCKQITFVPKMVLCLIHSAERVQLC